MTKMVLKINQDQAWQPSGFNNQAVERFFDAFSHEIDDKDGQEDQFKHSNLMNFLTKM